MPFCPKCRCEFVEGIQSCSDCEIELVSELPNQEQETGEQEEWEKILNVASVEEAEMIVELLKSSNIPAMPNSFVNEVLTFRDPKGVDIMVPQGFYEQAAELLKATLPSEMNDGTNYEEVVYDTSEEVEELNELNESSFEESTLKDSRNLYKIIAAIIVAIIIGVMLYKGVLPIVF